MRKYLFPFLVLLFLAGCYSFADQHHISTREIEYTVKGKPYKGFLALPKGDKQVPGVLVIHEWWGHNEYARQRARMLAEMGYAAFALDMYGKGKIASDPQHAGHLMNEAVNSGEIKERFEGAMKVLKDEKRVKQDSLAAIGYCFGGNVVMTMARMGEPLKAVASFHGSMPEKADLKPGSVKAEVMVFHGGSDPFVSNESVDAFKKEMDKAKAKYKVIVYKDAKHGFTDPDASARGGKFKLPLEYNRKADQESWEEMRTFFKRVL